jgi:hypothetical protein
VSSSNVARPPGRRGLSKSVRIIESPKDGDSLKELAGARTPRLVVVDRGSEPPMTADCYQDWMWRTGRAGDAPAAAPTVPSSAGPRLGASVP